MFIFNNVIVLFALNFNIEKGGARREESALSR